jgi:hypothetical protein
MRVKFSFCTWVMGVGRLPVPPSARVYAGEEEAEEAVTVLSTKVFHSPQSGQRPVHLGCSLPHCWQTNIVRVFGLGGILRSFLDNMF